MPFCPSNDVTNGMFAINLARSGLEQQNCNLPQVEINEVLRLMCHIRAEVSADDSMPCWIVLLVELLLDTH